MNSLDTSISISIEGYIGFSDANSSVPLRLTFRKEEEVGSGIQCWQLNFSAFSHQRVAVEACLTCSRVRLDCCNFSGKECENDIMFVSDINILAHGKVEKYKQSSLEVDPIFSLREVMAKVTVMPKRKPHTIQCVVDCISPVINVRGARPYRLMEVYDAKFCDVCCAGDDHRSDNSIVYSAAVVIKGEALVSAHALLPGNTVNLTGLVHNWNPDNNECDRVPLRVYVVDKLRSISILSDREKSEESMDKFSTTIPLYSSILKISQAVSTSHHVYQVSDTSNNTKCLLVLYLYPHAIRLLPGVILQCFNLQVVHDENSEAIVGLVATVRSTIVLGNASFNDKNVHSLYHDVNVKLCEFQTSRHYDSVSLLKRIHIAMALNSKLPLNFRKSQQRKRIIDELMPKERSKRSAISDFFMICSHDYYTDNFVCIQDLISFCFEKTTVLLKENNFVEGQIYSFYFEINFSLVAFAVYSSWTILSQLGDTSISFFQINDESFKVPPRQGSPCIPRLRFLSIGIIKLYQRNDVPPCEDTRHVFRNCLFLLYENSVYLILPHFFGYLGIPRSSKEDAASQVIEAFHQQTIVRQRLRYRKVTNLKYTFFVTILNTKKFSLETAQLAVKLICIEEIASILYAYFPCSKPVTNITTALCLLHSRPDSTAITLGGWDDYFSSNCPKVSICIENSEHFKCNCDINMESLIKLSKKKGMCNSTSNRKIMEGASFRNPAYLPQKPNIVLHDLYFLGKSKSLYCVEASLTRFLNVSCRRECYRCCSTMVASEEEKRVNSAKFVCKNLCDPKHHGINWRVWGILDDESAQILISAEHECAIDVLRLCTGIDDSKLKLIEDVAFQNMMGVTYSSKMPLNSLTVFQARNLLSYETRKRKANDEVEEFRGYTSSTGLLNEVSARTTLANFYLHHACEESKLTPCLFTFQLNKKSLGSPLSVGHASIETYFTNGQNDQLHRFRESTFRLSDLNAKLLYCRMIDDEDIISNIQNYVRHFS